MYDYDKFYAWGILWKNFIWSSKDATSKKNGKTLVISINTMFSDYNSEIYVRRVGYHLEQILVCVRDHSVYTTYKYLISILSKDIKCVNWIVEFLDRKISFDCNTIGLSPIQMTAVQCFVTIVCIAEVARGYIHAPQSTLAYLQNIIDQQGDSLSCPLFNLKSFNTLTFPLSCLQDRDYEPKDNFNDMNATFLENMLLLQKRIKEILKENNNVK